MLTVTDSASREIRGLLDQRELGGVGGLRIAANAGGDLTLALAAQPAEADQVVEAVGTRVFLDPPAAEALDDKMLDVSEQSPDGQVRFMLAAAE